MKSVFFGLRFGMMLQLAVGPLCFLTLQSAAEAGFWAGMQVAAAVTLADALFVTLAGTGVASVLGRDKAKTAVRWIGCLVLCGFGLHMIAGEFGFAMLPDAHLFSASGGGYFWQGFVLTASNPLTVIFWGGVFTTQITAHDYTRRQLVLFAAGCVLSTLLSLTAVSALGSVFSGFISGTAVHILNIVIGAVLIGYGLKLLLQKQRVVAE